MYRFNGICETILLIDWLIRKMTRWVRGICETILLIDWLIRKMTRWVRGICETIMLIDWLFREMTRWVRGICEAIRPLETLDVEGLVRLWAHEALRLFQEWNLNKLYKTVDNDFFCLDHGFLGIQKKTILGIITLSIL